MPKKAKAHHSRESGNPKVMKMDPALRIIAHGFSHGKTGDMPPCNQLSLILFAQG
jgi:hypothetical protein